MPAPEASLSERYAAVKEDVAATARKAGRDPATITTIVVTKFHPASLVRELVALGATDVGENRHQEAAAKSAELPDLDVRWHFVGQLQANKAAAALEYATVVHSVDRQSLVTALDRAEIPIEVFLQLNLTDDPLRGGVDPAGLEQLAENMLSTRWLSLLGIMAVAPLGEEPRAAFARVRAASERLVKIAPGADALSIGMSGDYREAILEGATHLRIGTAITGNRPPRS